MTGADLILTSGSLWDGTELDGDAIAVADGVVLTTGTTRDLLALRSDETDVIDVGSRRIIPGLIDSHIHMVRAGLTWADEVHWEGVRSLRDGLTSISRRTETVEDTRWVAAVGGWHPARFAEGRAPNRADLDEASPHHPVFVQRNYVEAFMNTRALEEMGWVEQHPDGHVTEPAAIAALRARLSSDDLERQRAGTTAMLRHLNGLGLTGAIDAAGFGMTSESYVPFIELFKDGERGFRARLLVGASRPGAEADDFDMWMERVSPGDGDDLLRYLGAGEILLYAAHDMEGLRPKDVSGHTDELARLTRTLASRLWPVHAHAILDTSVGAVLDAWSDVEPPSRLAELRYTICHADQVGEENLQRIRDLGLGITVQSGMSFRGMDSTTSWTGSQLKVSPRLRSMLDLGVPVGAGSDGTVASSFNPWQCISWMVSGVGADGADPRSADQRLTVDEALRLYTSGSAWFSFEEESRGNLRPGSHADLVVLSQDPLAAAAEEIAMIESAMTIVGGEIVHVSDSRDVRHV